MLHRPSGSLILLSAAVAVAGLPSFAAAECVEADFAAGRSCAEAPPKMLTARRAKGKGAAPSSSKTEPQIAKPAPAPPSAAPAETTKAPENPGKANPADAVPSTPAPPEEKTAWSDAEIKAALAECVRLLGPAAVEVEPATPMRAGDCGTPAPVLLKRIGPRPGVELRPPVTINCPMVARVAEWLEKVVEPAARETFGAPVVALTGVESYVCRFRNGAASGKLSEHAYANALDVLGFELSNKRKIDVLTFWGPTAHDTAKVAEAAAGKAASATDAAKAAEEVNTHQREDGKADTASAKTGRSGQPKQTPGAPRRDGAPPVPAASDDAAAKPERTFLMRVHKESCGLFSTVLGPEANEAHRNHFHLDLAQRRGRSYCQ